jgi:F0F1-type ATP synthase assembly protein I
MDSRKLVLRETAVVAIGQVISVAAMLGICILLGIYSRAVLLGGIFGGILAVLNFFFMAISAMTAADKAESQNVAGGKATVQLSFIVRMAVLFIVLFALIKSGLCDSLASVLPLVFTRPILSIGEFFRKSGEKKA